MAAAELAQIVTQAQKLNSSGLVLGMAGVAIIFRYGPPQPSLEEGVGLGLEEKTPLPDGRTVAEHNADVARLPRLYSRWSKTGLTLIFVGFALQLWAVWV